MVTQLSAHLGTDFLSIQDMWASISTPAPPTLALVPPTPTITPFNPASAPPDDDEMLGEEDFDLRDF